MNDCNTCGNPCNKGCKPARYSQGFKLNECNCDETDTKLSIDVMGATLNYSAEKHTDIITGAQLGSIIALPDLRDVNIDYDFDAMCAEFIYHKYGECGDGCKSLEDAWTLFSIDQDGAKQNQIRYVRGANAYGCPVFLDVPPTLDEYWFAGWRPDGEFGYYQPKPVDKLPTDGNGDPIVISQDPNTKQPLVGTIPLNCILNNLLNNFGVQTVIGFQAIQATPQFTASMNNSTGDFDIEWNDWNSSITRHVGTGHIYGTINYEFNFDAGNGSMSYTIKDLYIKNVVYKTDQGITSAPPIRFTLDAVEIGGTGRTNIMSAYSYTGNEDWTYNVNKTYPANATFTLQPGQTGGPFNFLYLYVDWVGDDEGYLNISFKNTLNGWQAC